MIDPLTSWQQACSALAGEEDFAAAFAVLEGALAEARQDQRAALLLYLASLHSLYGETGAADLELALNRARREDSASAPTPVAQLPLFLALSAELDARRHGEEAAHPALEAIHGEPLARYHALSALVLSGKVQEALGVALTPAELPAHLGWRLRSWQADSEEALGNSEAAMHLYAEAARLAPEAQRPGMLQEQAALLLQLGQPGEAETVLGRARGGYAQGEQPETGDPLGLASWHYLMSQARLNQDDTEAALREIVQADRLERAEQDPSYGVALVWGQVLVAQGRQQDALAHFEDALRLAEPDDRPYALHELGVALLDLDRPLEARERLENAVAVPEYPFAPEVLADIAEAEYRLGRLPEAQASAGQALAQGAVVPASLVLGSVALDYYHLDEALEHYQRVLDNAPHASRDWVTAQQMTADIMAQQGFPDPAQAYSHVQQALEHTEPSDDWYATLQDHASRAEALMGSARGRTLN